MDLIKENQSLKRQITNTEDNSKENLEQIVEKVIKKITKEMKNDLDETIEGFFKGNQKEKPNGLYYKKEDSKPNMFESFFNGILKNEREEK